jgi:high-affinity nickel-transport protein
MTSIPSILLLGFLLGLRHATDADHVVAVSTILQRDRSLRGAARIGSLWGAGHTATILLVGGAIVLFGLVIPPRVGLAMELAVGVMLVVLGALSLRSSHHDHHHEHPALDRLDRRLAHLKPWTYVRPLVIGVVHGLAGSAAVALLVLGAIPRSAWAIAYLAVFGAGTVAGMMLITTAMALPLRAAARRSARYGAVIGILAGLGSVAFGLFVVYRIGFVDGLFTSDPRWTPE